MSKHVYVGLVLFVGGLTISFLSPSKFYQQNDPWEVPEEYQQMENPFKDVEDEDRIGRILYSKYCKLCHGNKGKGDGSGAKLLNTPVADFTAASFKDQSDGALYYKISKGRGEMPSFEKIVVEEEDMWMLVSYIKGF